MKWIDHAELMAVNIPIKLVFSITPWGGRKPRKRFTDKVKNDFAKSRISKWREIAKEKRT